MRTGLRLLARSRVQRSQTSTRQQSGSRSVATVQEFCACSAGAVPIFEYVHAQPALRELRLQFGYGMVQGPRRAVAQFSGVEESWHVLVWVTADASCDGNWLLRHSVMR